MEPENHFPPDFLLNSTQPTPTTSSTNPTTPAPSPPPSSLSAAHPILHTYRRPHQPTPPSSSSYLLIPPTHPPPSPTNTASIATDLQTLSHKLPLAPPPNSNRTALILHLLNQLTPQWVSDFLFTPDSTHLPSFSRPPPPNTLLLTATITRLHTPDLHTPFSRPGDHTTASILLLPAFCIDTKTLGFGVAQGLELHRLEPSLAPPPHTPLFRKHLRFLHDTATHSLLLVIDSPADDTLLIAAWWHHHLTTTRTISVRLSRRHFLSALRHNHNVPSPPLMMASLISVTDQAQFCNCPRCGAAYVTGCGCEPGVRRARHAYDFAPFRESVRSGFGSFTGSGFRYREEDVRGFGVVSHVTEGTLRGLFEEMAEWTTQVKAFQLEGDEEYGRFGLLGVSVDSDSSGEPVEENSKESMAREQRDEDGAEIERVMGGEEKSAEELARLRRAKDRRERNRLAARRSNEKKKQERDAKKAELEILKQQEEALRKREASLRREQALLKDLVTTREDRMGRR